MKRIVLIFEDKILTENRENVKKNLLEDC